MLTVRAIQYQMTDSNGRTHTITIDLLHRTDFGENMARSHFLADALDKGHTFDSHEVSRIEIY
jgi:hypothetical protein